MRSDDHLSPKHLLRAIIVVQSEMLLSNEKPGSEKNTYHEKLRQRLLFRVRRQWAGLHRLNPDDFPWNFDAIAERYTSFRKEPHGDKIAVARDLWPLGMPEVVERALRMLNLQPEEAAENGKQLTLN
jgi:hypothetical protein